MLVGGDLMLGGTGTVTHIDGNRVYAFGHPMYNLGPTEFPMTRAYVYTVLPSLFSSMKLSTTGEIIGTVVQDRATAIAGVLGDGPRLIPITVSLESARAPKQTFHFGVVNDPLFGPLMTYASILNTLGSYERQFGAATFSVHGSARVRKHDPVAFDNLFAGDQSSMGAAAYIVGPMTMLMGNDYEKVDFEGLDVTFATDRRTENRDARAGVAGRPAAARGTHRAAEGDVPHLSRRRDRAHAADRDSGQRQRVALAAGVGWRAARHERAA